MTAASTFKDAHRPRGNLRSSSHWMPQWGLALLTILAAAPIEAQVDQQEVVVLRDGSIVEGNLVESVVGDHLTVRHADGYVDRIEWVRIEAACQVGGSSSPGSDPARVTATADGGDQAVDKEVAPARDSRLSLGLEGGFQAPLGFLALESAQRDPPPPVTEGT